MSDNISKVISEYSGYYKKIVAMGTIKSSGERNKHLKSFILKILFLKYSKNTKPSPVLPHQ